jgi:hypothetical protein
VTLLRDQPRSNAAWKCGKSSMLGQTNWYIKYHLSTAT